MRGKVPSQKTQRSQLRKKGIDVRRVKGKWTLYRLYNYYISQKHPKSDPRYLAYSTQKRMMTKIDTAEHPERIKVQTGTGRKVPVRQWVRKIDRLTAKQVEQEIPREITVISRRTPFKSGKRDDGFRYWLDPPVEINFLNYKDELNKLRQVHIPEITEIIDIFYQRRGRFYGSRVVGAMIFYDTKNTPDFANNPRPVKFGTRQDFPGYLFDMLYELIVVDILRHYKKANITIQYVEVYIRTQQRPSNIEQLL